MFETMIECFIGALAGVVSGNVLVDSYKKKKMTNFVTDLVEMQSPTYFEDKYGDDGIKWDKLMDRAVELHKKLPEAEREEFDYKMLTTKNFEEKFELVNEYEKKLKDMEK